jgi:hypothetical protein
VEKKQKGGSVKKGQSKKTGKSEQESEWINRRRFNEEKIRNGPRGKPKG